MVGFLGESVDKKWRFVVGISVVIEGGYLYGDGVSEIYMVVWMIFMGMV